MDRPRALARVEDLGEAAVEGLGERFAQRTVARPLGEFLKETVDDQPLRLRLGHTPGAQVVELLRIDLGNGRGVRATDVVGLDLEAGDRVSVSLRREEKVAALLEGIGLLRTGID